MDWPPRGHITTRPNHPPITDGRTGNVPPVNSPEAFARIAERMARENPDWQPGTVERAKQSNEGKPPVVKYQRCVTCPNTFAVTNGKTRLCPACRYTKETEAKRMRDRRRSKEIDGAEL